MGSQRVTLTPSEVKGDTRMQGDPRGEEEKAYRIIQRDIFND